VENNPALDFENNSYCYEVLVQNFCLEYSRADQTVDHCTIDLETTPGIDQIILNWSPYVGFPVGQYEIYRANTYNPNIPPLQIGVQPGTSLTFIDRETFCRDSISYRILAQGFGAITQRSFSDLDANAPIHPAPVLAADMEVATLVGDDTISTDSILVRWGEYTGYRPAAYILQKSEDGQNWSVIDTFGLAIRSYLDTDVDVYARSYYYRVFALDECGDQSVEGLEGRSILLRVQLNATGRIPLLTWTPYERWGLGVRNYQIEIYNEATGQWEAVDITPSSVRQYGDERSDLNQATYCYRIRAVEVGGTNAESVSNAECVTFGPAIFAPNAFSPNNDGHNDRFNVYVPNSRFAEITIFNRWGEQIYYSPDPQEGWDGTYKGQAVQEGVYLFVVRVTGVDGQPYERSGTITLIR
jgi:gliding motility-associated-like protein